MLFRSGRCNSIPILLSSSCYVNSIESYFSPHCHRQLYLIPFAARRTARRGSFLLLLSSSSYVIFRFLFFTFFSKPVKKNPYTTKALLFYVLVSHVNPKNSTGLSLSVEFFPSIPFLKRFLPLLWHLITGFSLAFPGISPQAIQTLWKNFCSRGGGVENRKGAERRVFPGFRPL